MRVLSPRASFRRLLAALGAALLLAGCAGMESRDVPRLNVVDLEPLDGQGLELRFNLKLRLQNPSEAALDYDGIALELELNGKPFASGVSAQKGSVPRFGEAVIGVPISVSAFAAVRQVIGLVGDKPPEAIPYVLRGKLAGGALGGTRFTETGTLSLPAISPGRTPVDSK